MSTSFFIPYMNSFIKFIDIDNIFLYFNECKKNRDLIKTIQSQRNNLINKNN